MKKCPYCAEEIQDEAVVCRYCGRDLLPAGSPSIENEQKTAGSIQAASAQVSIWRQGAKASAVISILYAISVFFTAPNTAEIIERLTVGLVVTFLFWWVVCAGIVWGWRKLGNNAILKFIFVFALLVVVCFFGSVASLISNSSPASVRYPTVTDTPRSINTPRPTERSLFNSITQTTEVACWRWDEVDRSIEGEDVCVFGDMLYQRAIQDANNNFQYMLIRFSQDTSKFYIVHNLEIDAREGDCIAVLGTLQFDSNGWPFIKNGDITKC